MGSSQSRLNDPSDPWHNQRSRRQRMEHHSSRTCQYIKTIWYIHGPYANNRMHMCGENDAVRILIRRCDCGKYEDAKYLLHDGKDLSPEGFGESIEMHISDECEYSQLILPNGTIRLDKRCYCARE
ncbi:hypothetical protein ACJMK2_017396 [Sinanodonta woodiana]|uniref:Uncharacterized protein n=1 Tax=Sinanodonta woodiana TaxID=1069815 RepID=A0ABD3UDC5_SINWO